MYQRSLVFRVHKHVYDAATHRLSSVSGAASWGYSYDVYGNVTGKGTRSFVYDDASNLVRDSLSTTNNYRYDGHNRRYWQKDSMGNQMLSVYSLDGTLVYQEAIEDGSIKDYVHLGSKLITRIDYCMSLDTDGMADGFEVTYGLNPLANDAALDADGDGLSNIDEFTVGTRPNKADTDNDGIPDGTDPRPLFNGAAMIPIRSLLLQ